MFHNFIHALLKITYVTNALSSFRYQYQLVHLVSCEPRALFLSLSLSRGRVNLISNISMYPREGLAKRTIAFQIVPPLQHITNVKYLNLYPTLLIPTARINQGAMPPCHVARVMFLLHLHMPLLLSGAKRAARKLITLRCQKIKTQPMMRYCIFSFYGNRENV